MTLTATTGTAAQPVLPWGGGRASPATAMAAGGGEFKAGQWSQGQRLGGEADIVIG